MARAEKSQNTKDATATTVGYEAPLWQMADALRGSINAAEYKHVALGLPFIKCISDAFEERQATLRRAVDDSTDDYYLAPSTRNRADAVARLLEDPDEYRSQRLWVPAEARWSRLKTQVCAGYDDNLEFNESADEAHGVFRIYDVEFRPSEVLFDMERESYRVYLAEFAAEAAEAEATATGDEPAGVAL